MKRAGVVLAVIVVAVAAWLGYQAYMAGQSKTGEPARPQGGQEQPLDVENVIWASGKLLPVHWAALSPASGGSIRTIHIAEGDQVEAETLLVDLDNAVLQSQVAVAEAALAEAQAGRDRLLAGATPSELAAARADVAAAEAGVAQAEAGVAQAEDAVVAAEAQVAIAEAQYRELASRPTPAEKVEAQRQIELARLQVEQAQRAYDNVRGDPEIGARPEALALQQATTNYEAAKAAYEVAIRGATQEQRAVSQAQINAARVQVTLSRGQIPSARATVQLAQAQLVRAQAVLDRLVAGPTQEDRAVAEARVQSAQAALSVARAQLRQTQIVAPFAGQVGTIYARPGELAVLGQPVLMLGDTSQMHVETTDLRETDVTRLREGMPVEVAFDALPGRSYDGTIARIAPMSTTEKGSTNYTVTVDIADLDPDLRWGMTAFVNIRVGE